ncbi:hypothetical protein [Paenochrobactrum pullorum]|uniref:hypothetical protein n=1 Tax=Paenochrobactrum pullorum TaxID=1324351 RepID=UPI0035BC25AA
MTKQLRKYPLIGFGIVLIALPCMPLEASASASPKQALKVLTSCLKGKTSSDEALTCIGRYSDPCATKAENAAPLPQISEQSQCLLDEASAWNSLTDRAVKSWKENNTTSLSANIAKLAKESRQFAKVKCTVFRDTQQFGQTGMALEAQCLRDEAARTASFIGYGLD